MRRARDNTDIEPVHVVAPFCKTLALRTPLVSLTLTAPLPCGAWDIRQIAAIGAYSKTTINASQ